MTMMRFLTLAILPVLLVPAFALSQPEPIDPGRLRPRELARVPVPNVVGRPQAQAEAILEEAGLGVGRVTETVSDEEPGLVVIQRPMAGDSVDPGTLIHLVISTGRTRTPPKVTVPDVVGLHIDHAIEVLREAQLRVGRVSETGSNKEPDTVLRQSPGRGTRVPIGSAVRLIVAIPTPPTAHFPWAPIIGGTLIVAAIVSLLAARPKRVRKTRNIRKPSLQLKPKRDLGTQKIESDAPVHLGFEVRLKPVSDKGTQEIDVEGTLIDEERREDE